MPRADPEILVGESGGESPGRLRQWALDARGPPESNDFWRFERKIAHFGDIFSGFTTKTHFETHFSNNFLLCKFQQGGPDLPGSATECRKVFLNTMQNISPEKSLL